MSDTASIRLPRTGSIGIRPAKAKARRAERAARTVREPRSPRAAFVAGTYVVVDAEYAARPAGTFTGVAIDARADGTFVSADQAFAGRVAGSYVG
ncbi:hypothetical protein [Frondihabitans sp. Leaf304]|uniref:hypothetical protein n=1 Tax=Frondihabitans sp. Leaf304 TaxID=1736329 RepID=UPI0006FC4BF8|nr:hypothetical protein [Frondihabitans sp. Leaf304]KQQ28219.1 hypothetical protein ASF54_05880 [Frondihabitans sp. Leaf304]